MKIIRIILCVSGAVSLLLLPLLLSGWAETDERTKDAMRSGNRLYDAADYRSALGAYESGLDANPDHKAMRYNAAQAAFALGDFAKALEYYEDAEDSTDKYLNAGNLYYWAGEAAEDDEMKLQLYIEALQLYEEGIRAFPQDVPLKYNYETVKEKLDEMLEDMEQESEDADGEGDEDGEEGESGDGEDADAEESDGEEGDGQEEDAAEAEPSGEDGEEGEVDWEAIERILQMLESQEEQSLKNNQEVVGGNDSKYAW